MGAYGSSVCACRSSEHPYRHVCLPGLVTVSPPSCLRHPPLYPCSGFASLRMWRQALAAFEKAKKDGLPITSSTYTQLINVMSKGGRCVCDRCAFPVFPF